MNQIFRLIFTFFCNKKLGHTAHARVKNIKTVVLALIFKEKNIAKAVDTTMTQLFFRK